LRPPPRHSRAKNRVGSISDELLSAVLIHGYPVMAMILLLGAIGLPVPTGLSVTLAGSLAAMGRLDWLVAAAIARRFSAMCSDMVSGGCWGSGSWNATGRWLGYTPGRRAHVQALFDRWGAWTILVTRTLAFSSELRPEPVGGSRPLLVFVAFDAVARRAPTLTLCRLAKRSTPEKYP
jgi:membrane protein DedA with SNARE-associated domain